MFKLPSLCSIWLFVYLTVMLVADIKSTKDSIGFDLSNDGNVEMTLNSTGLSLGSESPSSTLEVNGSFGMGVQLISSNTTLSNNSLVLVDTSSDNITLQLPLASSVGGRSYWIKKRDVSNQLWIQSSETIDGTNDDLELSRSGKFQSFVQLFSDGSSWYVLNSSEEAKLVVGSDNLVGWWKLDESRASTVAVDSSRNNRNGTISNIDDDDIGIKGVDGLAMYFDGTNDGILLPTYPEVGTDQGSISVFFKVIDFPNHDRAHLFYGADSASGDGYGGEDELHLTAEEDEVVFFIRGGVSIASSGNYVDGNWHHAVATWDSTDGSTLYIDNQIVGTDASSPNDFQLSQNVRIGRPTNGSRYFNGYLDDVRLYNRALTSAEVENICKSLTP